MSKPSQSVAAGLVEVNVRVDQAGENVQVGRVDFLFLALPEISGAISTICPFSTAICIRSTPDRAHDHSAADDHVEGHD